MGKKIGKLFLKILGGIILFIFLLLMILRIPAVQTKIAQFATKKLSKQLNTTVSIDKVAMNFVDNACVRNIYIEDQSGDTLLYAHEIYVDIAFLKLLRNVLEIDQATLNTGVIKVSQNQDSIFNFQFAIDAFASADTATTTPSENPMLIDLDRVNFNDFRAYADLLDSDNRLYFDELAIKISKFDMVGEVIDIDRIDLNGLFVESLTEPANNNKVVVDTSTSTLEFPLGSVPYDLTFDKINVNGAQIALKEKGFEPADTFDSRYIDINNLQLSLSDLHLNDQELEGSIDELHFNLNNKFQLNDLNSKIVFTDQTLSIQNLNIDLPNSKVNASLETNYQNLQSLSELDSKTQVKLDIPGINLSFKDLQYFVSLDALGPFQDKVLEANGSASGTFANLKLDKLHLAAGNTVLDANGRIKNLSNTENIGIQNFKISGKADYEEYALFLPNDTIKRQMEEIGDISFNLRGTGNLQSMMVENLEIYTESLAEAKFSGKLENLTDTDALKYDVKIHHITTGYQDATIFVDSLPDMIKKFDTITYAGTAKGDLYDITLDGSFNTSLGDMETDLSILFNEDYDDAAYQGRLQLEDFQLGELLEDDSIGRISMTANIDGSGLDTESIRTELDGVISKLEYNGYTYQNIEVDGLVDGMEFSGKMNIDDENVKLDFQGTVDLNDSIPVMNFNLALDTLNLEQLNLSDSLFQVQLDIDADIAGLNLDDADGELTIKNIKLTKRDRVWTADSIDLIATRENGNKGLYLNAPFMTASVEGDYKLSVLSDVFLDFLDQYFPLKTFLGRTAGEDAILDPEEKRVVSNDVIDATIKMYDVVEIANFFDVPIQKMDTASLEFALDVPNNLTEFDFHLPSVTYDGYYIEEITAKASNDDEQIESNFNIDSVSITESIHLGGINMDLILREQSATLSTLIRNQKNEESLGFTTRITSSDSTEFVLNFMEDFILNNQNWNLTQDSGITLDGGQFTIPPININNGSEAFNISGSNQKIDLQFTDFNLNNLVEIVGVDSLDVTGQINGDLEVGLDDETPISGDLTIYEINFNEFNIGDLVLDATKDGQDVEAVMTLTGEEVKMDGNIEYDLSSSYLFGRVLVDRLNLEPFAPFVNTYARDLEGSMQGYIAIDGRIADPDISGALYFQEVEAFIVDLGTIYRIKEGKINVADGLIKPDATLQDQENRLSYLKGDIRHDFFTNIRFDLDFNAEAFKFLNSKENKSEYFYGVFVGKVDAKITGSTELPVITADITALEGTDLTVQLLSSAAVLTQESYMVFYDGSEISGEDAIDSISMKAYQPNSSIELDLALSASDDALFHVVVDPVTGDRLDVRGNTDLAVDISADGSLNIVGEYVVSEGRYRVSYENTIRRTFEIDAGSRIVFQGDPYNAGLDLRAIYGADVSLTPLLQKTGAGIDEGSGSARTRVNVVLNVGGVLSSPDLSFNIVAPEVTSSPVGNAITNALAQLRLNETQLLEQVGSIILFNSFTGGSSGGNISNVGTSTAVNSVGNLINTQLNKLASRADGFEIDFNIDQYQDAVNNGQNITEFGIGLQQRLFNDRLIISAGGNANLETGQAASNNFSSFAGDFVIQYLLTEEGQFRVKVFQKSDFNALNNSNIWKTGVGLSYKTEFGQIKTKK
ncbi:translocation/assembly module TamB domain-containing protein [Portibacter marinus]|uniref:translocation/assembly module TamB domain-containing protein n=1 Tax=Portibacter marinus TaxID=2898660 RepID=UPI001F1653BF|nr:translocation/assembly module TamB domain-containing protein [Portibacter marinus]